LLAGEQAATGATTLGVMFQSTPAIAGGRTIDTPSSACRCVLFQSTPAIAGGRTLFTIRSTLLSGIVSIHARHCWRANSTRATTKLLLKLFQSTPAIAGGRTLRGDSAATSAFLFQSTPAIAGGRTSLKVAACPNGTGFNPRPPLLAGEPAG